MTCAELQDAPATSGTEAPAPSRSHRRAWHACVVSGYLLTAAWVTSSLWASPGSRFISDDWEDTVQLRWLLLHATRLFTHGENPFFTHLLNAPHGVNLMDNTSVLAVAIPLTPVTLAFGPAISAAVFLTLAPAATATAWYWFLARNVVRSPLAAALGGLLAGFAPSMISQDCGHPNVASQFLLPLILAAVLRLRIPGRVVRTGCELALLVVLQAFLNEEVLLLAAVATAVFLLALLATAPRLVLPHLRRGLAALGVTTVLVAAALAWPLYWQFFGPMSYRGLGDWVQQYPTDLASYPAHSSQSLLGPPSNIAKLAQDAAEQNTFFGPVLLVLLLAVVAWRFRSPLVRALAVTTVVAGILGLGRYVRVNGHVTGVRGPWYALSSLPVFDTVVPTRISLLITPIAAILLALGVDQAVRLGRRWGPRSAARRCWAVAWTALLAAALVPIAPLPIRTGTLTASPVFFTSGHWRAHVPTGTNLQILPLIWGENIDAMQFQIDSDLGFAITGGYFLAPTPGSTDRSGRFGPDNPPIVQALNDVVQGHPLNVNDIMRLRARLDFAQHHVSVLVVPVRYQNSDELRRTIDQLVGPGQQIDDVWVWDLPRQQNG